MTTTTREQLKNLEVPKMIVWIDDKTKIETTHLTDKTIGELEAIIDAACTEAVRADSSKPKQAQAQSNQVDNLSEE